MYVIVIGGGRVGYYLTKALLDEGHEILIIERDKAISEAINEELGSICLRGDGCEIATLNEAGTDRADMVIAVTGDDEDNLVACQVAKHKFKVPRTIARIGNPRNEILFKKLGIDITISSTSVILENIEAEVPTHPLTHLLTIRDKGLEVVDIKIPSNSPIVGKQIKELVLPPGSILALIIRKESKPIIPAPDTNIQGNDQIIAVISHEAEEALRASLRGK